MTSISKQPNPNTSARWLSENLDLDAYLERIHYFGSRAPNLETLRGLQRAHLDNISFENLEIMMGDKTDINLLKVQSKLIRHGRGGYCHEHNTLFGAVLERLGFTVAGRSARILMGISEVEMTPVGHTLLNVNLDGSNWLVDVGVGNVGPREPIELKAGNEVTHDAWRYRIDRVAHYWVLRYWRHNGWFNIYQLSDEPYYRSDFEHHNYYVSTHPESPFTQQLIAQYNGATIRYALTGLQLKTFLPDKPPLERSITAEELPGILKNLFNVTIDEDVNGPRWMQLLNNVAKNKSTAL